MTTKLYSLILDHKTAIAAAAAFFIFGIFLGNKAPLSQLCADADGACAGTHHNTEVHCADDHSGHGHSAGAADLDALTALKCEHEIGIVDCDECRFEVGVVKIDPAAAASLIKTGVIENVERTKTLRFTGQVQLNRTTTVDVVPAGGGRIKKVEKFLGDSVLQGDILAVIHSDDLGQAKADYLEIQSAFELAEATFNREKDLYEKKISSQADYLTALNEVKAAQAAYAAADKKLRLFGLETEHIDALGHEKANGSFGDLILRAPQAGTVIAQHSSVGQIVTAAESIFTIADLTHLWVWCDVYEKDLAVLHDQSATDKPLAARVRVKAFESVDFPGEADFIGHLMDEPTRTIKMRVQVGNPEKKLRPGMFADVEIAIPPDGRMLAIPAAAVMTDAGETFAFQYWKDDLWVRRDVTVGGKYGPVVELLGGIPVGATVVTSGAFMLKSDILREKMGAGCAD